MGANVQTGGGGCEAGPSVSWLAHNPESDILTAPPPYPLTHKRTAVGWLQSRTLP